MTVELNVETWAKQQFGTCEMGDVRRTARAVKMASQFATHPRGSTPEQTESWSDCKAAYNLLNSEEVTFSALARPHWEQTKARTSGHYLLLGDTTTVSFDGDRQIAGMGIVSSGTAHGYLLHSSLMVEADQESIIFWTSGTPRSTWSSWARFSLATRARRANSGSTSAVINSSTPEARPCWRAWSRST